MADVADRSCGCKVGRVVQDRGLDGLGERLADRWVDGDESLRDLARRFDLAVLEAATRDAGMTPLEGEIENVYRLLTDDDVTSGMRRQCRNRLERAGVDPDAVLADFVSHQTVHTHLKECVGVDREQRTPDVDAEADRVQSLRSRLEAVAGDAVTRLADADAVAVDDADVYVDVAVVCRDCGSRTPFGELLDAGGCDCSGGE